MMSARRSELRSWLWGETLLTGLLGASLAFFLSYPVLRTQYDNPQLLLVLETTTGLAGILVAVLAGIRLSVDGLRTDLLLATGFVVSSLSVAVFAIGPLLAGGTVGRAEGWTAIIGGLVGTALVAAAPFVGGRSRERALVSMITGAGAVVAIAWVALRTQGMSLPALAGVPGRTEPPGLASVLSLQALLELLAVLGWGRRFVRTGDDFAQWLALGFTLQLFAALHLVFTPPRGTTYVAEGDFLRLLSFAVVLFGAWRAIRAAEFGRVVAEERARVAREIHDGLAQYLFAVATHAQMLEAGAPVEEVAPQLKEAANLAQQEARFAILALSSASGTASFDAALSRYVELLAADGELEIELDVDPDIHLAPDEQIEIFRIVQEGLGNIRRHAGATQAHVAIGVGPTGERFVTISDNGDGFEEGAPAGHGLRNMRARAAAIEGGFSLRSARGAGTSLEIVLRE